MDERQKEAGGDEETGDEGGGAGQQIGNSGYSPLGTRVHPNHLGRVKAQIAQRVNEGFTCENRYFLGSPHTHMATKFLRQLFMSIFCIWNDLKEINSVVYCHSRITRLPLFLMSAEQANMCD